jgi:hypothetical protein
LRIFGGGCCDGVRPVASRPLMEETEVKQILIVCDHCEHKINFHDLFQRQGPTFYHALCWELYLLERVEKVRAFKQEHSPHAGLQPPSRHGNEDL